LAGAGGALRHIHDVRREQGSVVGQVNVRELSAERWQRLQPVLDGALELPLEERAVFLDRACGGDAQLRRDADTLLSAAQKSATFLEAPAAALLGEAGEFATQPSSRAGTVIGRYRIVRELGHGGMGTVYLAERADGEYDQRVALKLIRGGASSEELVRRFLHERQILARLEHANIARLLDGGFTPDGEPYFAMELVDGEPINQWCEKHDLPIDERLRLFRCAAEAVAYAHRNLVVHRDLKPSNVLVTATEHVKLLDFGIAKLLEDNEVESGLTRTGLYIMTPEYAAPEQVHGGAVTTATDVYTLGAVLYELLSGQRVHRLTQHTPAEFARVICDEDPVPPSTAAFAQVRTTSTAAANGISRSRSGAAARRLRRFLHGDLDNIVMKALRKEPERRYASVDAFIEDIDRYQKGLPVLARRDSFGYRAAKFARRHRAGVAAAALVVLSLVAGLIGTTLQARQAALESAKAEQVKNFVIDLFTLADPDLSNGENITARELLERGDARVNDLANQPELQAEMLAVLGSIDKKLGLYEEAAERFQRALEIERRLHGPRDSSVAARLHDLGETALDRSRIEEAQKYHEEALALRRDIFGERHPEVARSLRAMAESRNANGQYDEAEQLQRLALAINREHFGVEHVEVAFDLEILATILQERGDYAEAVATGRESLAMREKLLGDDHLETATARNNLAGYLRRTGDLAAADLLYRQVLAFDLRRLGADHPNTATVTNNLAGVLWERGDLEEAEKLFREVLEFDRRHFGEDHRYTALVMQNLAGVLKDRRAFDESERLLNDAHLIFRRVLGDDHPWTGLPVAMLASVRHDRGDLETAEAFYRSAITQLTRTLGPHPRLASAQLGLGRLLIDRGSGAEAEPLLREALRVFLESYPPTDVRIADARGTLGQSLVAQQRFAEAESLLVTSYRAMEERPADRARLRDAAGALVQLYDAWQKPAQAERYRTVAAR
jgi:serine/threonine-protein kinase